MGVDAGKNPEIVPAKWRATEPGHLGRIPTSGVVHFITAPLLVAAALSLAGVVGAAVERFRWPGPTLLLLVFTALTLLASIQLSYHARQFLYSYQDLNDWLSPEYVEYSRTHDEGDDNLHTRQQQDFQRWEDLSDPATHCFNIGTILLALGLAAALVPPDHATQAGWRWGAAALVLVAALADAVWIAGLYRPPALPGSAESEGVPPHA
ncbi:hypothetical protein [Streptacidiphilus sp. PAMC 29251]